ncbi:hypothetical protein [Verrucomicrobium spinosum]|nr:hypothetical protein [Verrucomicrobium spinosum]
MICKSRTYQLGISTNKWNEDDKINYSHAKHVACRRRRCLTPSTR